LVSTLAKFMLCLILPAWTHEAATNSEHSVFLWFGTARTSRGLLFNNLPLLNQKEINYLSLETSGGIMNRLYMRSETKSFKVDENEIRTLSYEF
jgi:hypothetical protein